MFASPARQRALPRLRSCSRWPECGSRRCGGLCRSGPGAFWGAQRLARRRTSSSCRVSEKLVPWGLRRPLPVLFSLSERCVFETQRPFYSARFLLKLVLGPFLGDHDDGRVRPRTWRRLFRPRNIPFGVLGDLPEFELGQVPVAAQHPPLGVELAVTCPQGPDGTPLGPSRALGCPMAYASRDAAAARRHGCPCYQAPYGRPRPRRHRRGPTASPQGPRQHAYARPAPALARLDRTPSPPRASEGETRQESGVVLFFFYDKT